MLPVDETVDTVDLDLHPNEASDLAVVPGGLARYDQTFVTVLDEGVIEESIAILGHRGDDVTSGWDAVRLSLTPTDHAGRTEDAEACDFWGEHLYVLGSHFGSKDGPLEAKRAWIARVRTADLAAAVEGAEAADRDRPQPLRAAPGGQRPPARVGRGAARARPAGARAAGRCARSSAARRRASRGRRACSPTTSR